MDDKYYAGDEGLSLFRVTDDMEMCYLEWSKKRWRQDNYMAYLVAGVGGVQSVEEIAKTQAREMLAGQFDSSTSSALINA
ncbi:MAG: hypothetical protein IIC72_11650 [Acidobacteria bacterium]|nr:hypothetical protein [Acidobacteriota bacterium]